MAMIKNFLAVVGLVALALLMLIAAFALEYGGH